MKNYAFAIVLALGFIAYNGMFIVVEGSQAIVLRFGKIIRDPITEAGLKFKVPFLDEVKTFEKRIVNWDGEASHPLTTKDKKFIYVDTGARWRISEPVLFYERSRHEGRANTLITNFIDSATKSIVSNYNLVETVRNTNDIITRIEEIQSQDDGDDMVTGEIESIPSDERNSVI